MLELFYSTGCRRAEILSIDIQDINWSGRYIRILGKENKERFVFFSVRCSKLLMEYLSGRAKGQIFISKRYSNAPIGKQAIADELRNIGILRVGASNDENTTISTATILASGTSAGMDLALGESYPYLVFGDSCSYPAITQTTHVQSPLSIERIHSISEVWLE